ncbi:hypothetical protein [Anoxybacillus sp. J5B_2022]|uniref:hypothetical protein n=1 Tax=Anoxybacillus sp. J5B_2022 TaxID=3003246 RepID=UPI0022859DE9|nr:hypothetical protein [Anoxybacillus sp. J5B_2022]MCZ0753996.1 hypothetical protein [Anoxybacillus sp. J5B_2022]
MEQLLLQLMNEMRAFRTEVNERLTQLENGLQQVNGRLDHVESNLQQVNGRLDHVESNLQQVNERLDHVESNLQQVNGRLDHVETNLQQVNERLDHVETELKEVKQGQAEMKELLKHHTTLTIETLTNMRKEIRTITNDMQADVNLLFREVETVKRQVNKVEQRLAN